MSPNPSLDQQNDLSADQGVQNEHSILHDTESTKIPFNQNEENELFIDLTKLSIEPQNSEPYHTAPGPSEKPHDNQNETKHLKLLNENDTEAQNPIIILPDEASSEKLHEVDDNASDTTEQILQDISQFDKLVNDPRQRKGKKSGIFKVFSMFVTA